MKQLKYLLGAFVWASLVGLCSQLMTEVGVAQQPLKAGDRIVFLGDSITQAGARPGGYVSQVRDALNEQMADLKVEVIGAGISGNKVPDLQARLEKDVLAQKPTVVVIYIGINDVWHSTRNAGTPKDVFEAGLNDLIKKITDAQARVILCTASVIGEKTDGSNSLDGMLEEYCAISRKVAEANKVQLLDLRKLFIEHLKVSNPEGKPHSILTTDGVHLNGAGDRFVAECMLGALGVPVNQNPNRLLRHVVLFKFKADATKEQIQAVDQAFRALPEKIKQIHAFEAGTDVSVEGLAKGFTNGYVVTFRGESDRALYLPHPDHQKFVELVKPIVDDVLVFDYWTK